MVIHRWSLSSFRNRTEAGQTLAELLHLYADDNETIVFGLPNGGIAVGAEVANRLNLPLDLLSVRRLALPDQKEWRIGAIATNGTVVLDDTMIARLGLSQEAVSEEIASERVKLERQELMYRQRVDPLLTPIGKRAIVVNDGAATGLSLLAAVHALQVRGASSIIVAVPVASPTAIRALREIGDKVVCILAPGDFISVGEWFGDFSHISDEEMMRLLQENRYRRESSEVFAQQYGYNQRGVIH